MINGVQFDSQYHNLANAKYESFHNNELNSESFQTKRMKIRVS